MSAARQVQEGWLPTECHSDRQRRATHQQGNSASQIELLKPIVRRAELELELIQSHMAQKPVLRGEVGCACVACEVSVERGGMGERRQSNFPFHTLRPILAARLRCASAAAVNAEKGRLLAARAAAAASASAAASLASLGAVYFVLLSSGVFVKGVAAAGGGGALREEGGPCDANGMRNT